MGRYTEEQKMDLRRVAIVQVMAALGLRTDHDRHSMYYSPFREERTPSFHISTEQNVWYDFGTSEGGGVLDLVRRLRRCSWEEAYDFLATIDRTIVPDDGVTVRKERKDKGGAVTIMSTSRSFRPSLLSYAEGRGIPGEILRRYCHEVTYSIEGMPGRTFYAIGFRNSAGGYALRNSRYKMCSSSAATYLSPTGGQTAEPQSQNVMVFEGFFDFLSYMVLSGRQEPGYDICVLNSVANLEKTLGWLYAHRSVVTFLDNDDAGRRATILISDNIPDGGDTCVEDLSEIYAEFNDLSEMLEAGKQSQSQTIKYQEKWNSQFQRKSRKGWT